MTARLARTDRRRSRRCCGRLSDRCCSHCRLGCFDPVALRAAARLASRSVDGASSRAAGAWRQACGSFTAIGLFVHDRLFDWARHERRSLGSGDAADRAWRGADGVRACRRSSRRNRSGEKLDAERFGGFSTRGVSGQFGVGLLLGAVGRLASVRRSAQRRSWRRAERACGMVALTSWHLASGHRCRCCSGYACARGAVRWREWILGRKRAQDGAGRAADYAGMLTLSALIHIDPDRAEQALPDWILAVTTRI